jgi:monovalent cation:H+ antiporter-2, CPA2 family
VGMGLAQIGEFSFIIANLGRTSGVTSGALYPIAVAVSLMTTLVTPYLLRSAHAVTAVLTRVSPRPLLTFATFYSAWVTRLTFHAPRVKPVVQALFLRLLLYLAVTVTLFVTTWSGARPLVRLLPRVLPKQDEVLQWAIAAAVVLPFLFLISRTLETLIQNITATLLQRRRSATVSQTRLVRDTLYFLLSWIVAVFVLAVGSPVLPPLVPLGVVGLGLLVTTYLFWGSLTRFHARIESVLSTLSSNESALGSLAPESESGKRTAVTQLLSDRYGLAVQTEDFVVPLHPTALNRPIQALNLRSLTGASIIAIYRDPEQVLVPQADTVLLPGDVLVLLGEQDQLEAALRLLTELGAQKANALAPLPQLMAVVVAEDSAFVGHTLVELNLQKELGVLIVGVQRGSEQLANPGPDFAVQPHDVLYLWGAPEDMENVRFRVNSGEKIMTGKAP